MALCGDININIGVHKTIFSAEYITITDFSFDLCADVLISDVIYGEHVIHSQYTVHALTLGWHTQLLVTIVHYALHCALGHHKKINLNKL